IVQCCSLGQLKQYNPNEVIYSTDKGRLNSVYFVLSGNCTILQTLKLMHTNTAQTKKYYLVDVENLDSPARLLLEKLHFEADKRRKFSNLP
ncbi:hypothetical protein Bhyg_11264, partial [Pseudolycoriella hygida]